MNKRWVENELGILVEEEIRFEKRDLMTRREWAIWHSQELITEQQWDQECAQYQWMKDRNMS
jgi:hypothetical protein